MKQKMDLANKKIAEQSRNKTAIICFIMMNALLAGAYLLEVVKGVRTIGSYLIVAVLCLLPCVLATLMFLKKKEALLIRYICTVGFALLYGYVMFTTSSDLTFCYVLVAAAIIIVYADVRLSVVLSGYALIVNVIRFVLMAVAGELVGVALTNAEIIIACILFSLIFTIMAVNKIAQIGDANVEKAELQNKQTEELLETVLNIAESITENIGLASQETDGLKDAIDATRRAMEELTAGTNDTVNAITEQQERTDQINSRILDVGANVSSIMAEIKTAEDNLENGNVVMNDLLAQVKVSEEASTLVAGEMKELKEYADRMQDIMGLISSVANQTGMLALNASIEAARAGEAGRGFSVVASEISSLASQTNSATTDINKLIENITNSVQEVTVAIDKLLESNRMQSEYVDNTASSFEEIHNSTQRIVSQTDELKAVVDEVTEANKQVMERIENVSAITEEVTASASETLENCNLNLKSVEKMTEIMNVLGAGAEELSKNGNQ